MVIFFTIRRMVRTFLYKNMGSLYCTTNLKQIGLLRELKITILLENHIIILVTQVYSFSLTARIQKYR